MPRSSRCPQDRETHLVASAGNGLTNPHLDVVIEPLPGCAPSLRDVTLQEPGEASDDLGAMRLDVPPLARILRQVVELDRWQAHGLLRAGPRLTPAAGVGAEDQLPRTLPDRERPV